jgi:hypothetical protein
VARGHRKCVDSSRKLDRCRSRLAAPADNL